MELSIEVISDIKEVVLNGSSLKLTGKNIRKIISKNSRYFINFNPLELENRIPEKKREIRETSRIFIKYVKGRK